MSQKEKQKRIYWGKDESGIVIKEVLRLYFEDENIWAYFEKAQKVLPHDRRRKIIGRSGVSKDLIDLFCKERQEVLEQGIPFGVPIEVPVEKEVLVERPREDVLKSITTKELLILLAERIAPLIDGLPTLVHQAIKPATTTPVIADVHQKTPSPKLTPRKAKVLMCGFLEGQRSDITEKASGFKLELLWRKKDTKNNEAPPSCDYCVTNVKVSHSESSKMKRNFDKSRFRLASGITEALKALAHFNSLAGTGA